MSRINGSLPEGKFGSRTARPSPLTLRTGALLRRRSVPLPHQQSQGLLRQKLLIMNDKGRWPLIVRGPPVGIPEALFGGEAGCDSPLLRTESEVALSDELEPEAALILQFIHRSWLSDT